MKRIGLLAILLILAACAASPTPEQIVIVVTATPAPNEMVIRITHTPASILAEAEVPSSPRPPEATATQTIAPTPTYDLFPDPVAKEIFVAEQEFERARFFWLEPAERAQSIWVLYYEKGTPNKGRWGIFEDTFEEGEISIDPNIVAPEGLLQPIRGFGKLWRNNSELRSDVGWAQEREFGYIAEYRYEYGGEVVSDEYIAAPGVHFITSRENKTFRFDETDFTWSIVDD